MLLAEDNEINQQIAVELLQGVGATVEVANDGLEAVRKMLNQQVSNFDVVLMDIQMPEMDGYQATKKIRSDPRFASFPIIAMTAHATIEERQKCLDAGMNGHVSKPIDPSSLFETVGALRDPNGKGRAVRRRARLHRAVAEADELPEVPGLNTAEGLVRVAGNKKLYRKLLRQFSNTEAMPPSASPRPWPRMIAPWPSGWPTRSRAWPEISAPRCSECGRQSGESHCGFSSSG